MVPCPSDEHLRKLLADQLGGAERERLESHLRRCPSCDARLARATEAADSAGWRRLYGAAGAERPVTADAAFLERLKRDPPTEPHPGPSPDGPTELPAVAGYELVAVLGHGGMGVVYKARQVALKRLVALKMLPAGSPRARRARFRREAEALARLQHPNIVQIHEVGEHDGRPFFSMEFVAGGSLADKLDGTPWPAREAARLVEVLARAVGAAHRQGVVHRDLKPANVLLTADGTPKVGDFGIAKRLDDDEDGTRTGLLIGTPCYMAPEQASGLVREVGPAADVYALGVVLYELLVGRPPFQGPNPLDTLEQARSQEPVPPRRLQPRLPRDLDTVCLKCLEKAAGRRYPGGEALADDLRRFLAGEPVRARAPSFAEGGWRWCRRHPAFVSFLALLVFGALLSTALAAVALWQRGEAVANAGRADDERRKAQRESARLALEAAWPLYEQGEGGWGLVSLARALQLADDAGDADLADAARRSLALGYGQTHELRAVLRHPGPGRSTRAVFSPDGRTAATCARDRIVCLWDLADGRLIRTFEAAHPVDSVLFHPGGALLLTGDQDGEVRRWHVATGADRGLLCKHERSIACLAFSPDGRVLLSGSAGGHVRLSDPATGDLLRELVGHEGEVHSAAFSRDGRAIVTGGAGRDQTARLWDAATGRPRGAPVDFGNDIWAVAFTADGRRFLTGSSAGHAVGWDTEALKPAGPVLEHQGAVHALDVSPDGRTILTGSADMTARLWDATTTQVRGNRLRHQHQVDSVRFSPDGRSVLTAGNDGTVRLWGVAAGSLTLPHGQWVQAVAFSPDGQTVATGCSDGTARLWDAATGDQLPVPFSHPPYVSAVAFSPDGKTLATGNLDGSAELWDVAARRPRGVRATHRGPVRAVAFRRQDDLFLTASEDGTAALWDRATGRPVRSLEHSAPVLAAAFSPDGSAVVTGCKDGKAQLWQTATGAAPGPPLSHTGEVWAVAFSPDGRTVLTGGASGTARLWDAATGRPLDRSFATPGPITALAFGPDGQTVLTGGADGKAQLWHLATGERIGHFLHRRAIMAVAFSPDGRKVATSGKDTTGRLWDVPAPAPGSPEQVLLYAQTITGLEPTPGGSLSVLDAAGWEARRAELRRLGWPPLHR